MQISLVIILNANIFVIGMAIATSTEYEAYKLTISGYSYNITLIPQSGFCCPFMYQYVYTTIKYKHCIENDMFPKTLKVSSPLY